MLQAQSLLISFFNGTKYLPDIPTQRVMVAGYSTSFLAHSVREVTCRMGIVQCLECLVHSF